MATGANYDACLQVLVNGSVSHGKSAVLWQKTFQKIKICLYWSGSPLVELILSSPFLF